MGTGDFGFSAILIACSKGYYSITAITLVGAITNSSCHCLELHRAAQAFDTVY